jgi:streptogramin lyase
LTPLLFTGSLSERKIIAIKQLDDVIKGQLSIITGFTATKSGNVFYAGTMPQPGTGMGGHIIELQVSLQGQIAVKDLGEPVAGEGIFAMTFNADKNEFYGIVHPSGKFFTFNLKTGKTQIFNQTVPSEKDLETYHSFALQPEDYLGRALLIDQQGRIYGSRSINKLFCFDPANQSFSVLKDELPFVWGREAMGRIDSWVKMPEGTIYGSNAADGQLFRLDPVNQTIVNLGKPIMMPRIMAMTPGKNGMLYGVAGAFPGYAHLFSYHPQKGFRDLGNPEFKMVSPGLEQGINWRGYQIASMASSQSGNYIIMGENEALSQLMVFPAEDVP